MEYSRELRVEARVFRNRNDAAVGIVSPSNRPRYGSHSSRTEVRNQTAGAYRCCKIAI
jgi:hypothetical protein